MQWFTVTQQFTMHTLRISILGSGCAILCRTNSNATLSYGRFVCKYSTVVRIRFAIVCRRTESVSTNATDSGSCAIVFISIIMLHMQVENGSFTLTISIDTVMTLSTIDSNGYIATSVPPNSQPFPIPYEDTFEGVQPVRSALMFGLP